MTADEMKARTKGRANRIVRLCAGMPDHWVTRPPASQLLRNAAPVGANYRAVYRAKSRAGSVNKLRIVEEERDESLFWIGPVVENRFLKESQLRDLMTEADAISASRCLGHQNCA